MLTAQSSHEIASSGGKLISHHINAFNHWLQEVTLADVLVEGKVIQSNSLVEDGDEYGDMHHYWNQLILLNKTSDVWNSNRHELCLQD